MCSDTAFMPVSREPGEQKRMLFRRDFGGYTGGHGKVHDYFEHTRAHPYWSPRVFVTPSSVFVENPWATDDARVQDFRPEDANALFLGGMDWADYPHDHADTPVINLVQHVRHADPAQPLSRFLLRRAIRICVSKPVADAILATGRVRGPVLVIEAALNLPAIPDQGTRHGIFIDAIKQPDAGRRLAAALGNHRVRLSNTRLSRQDYAAALAGAEIAVLLPHATEGFYLPALEAMASGCAVVVPDCIGNRAYLEPGHNALVPDGEPGLTDAVLHLSSNPQLRARLAEAGKSTAARFELSAERRAFHGVLDSLGERWADA